LFTHCYRVLKCVLIFVIGDGEEGGSDKTEPGQTAGTDTARSRAESLVDSTEGMDDSKSKQESDDGMHL